MNKIIQGDSLEVLRTLDSSSVDCCITSPPYWQLRDYHTATWEGGDNNCDHITGRATRTITDKSKKQTTNVASNVNETRNICPKCGARRIDRQLGLEPTFNEYIDKLVSVFNEVKRVLKPEGTLWVNLGDSYSGSGGGAGGNPDKCKESFTHSQKPKEVSNISSKSLCLIPSRFAIAMIYSGWTLRNDIIWHKPNCMPESVKDRFTNDYEHLFFFTKQKKYYFNQQFEPYSPNSDMEYRKTLRLGKYYRAGNQNPYKNNTPLAGDRKATPLLEGKNKRSVWTIPTKPSKEKHYASYPVDLVKIPIDAGCPQGGLVLDPFCGTATTCVVAKEMGRNYIGIDLNPEYCDISNDRLKQLGLAI